MVVTTIIGGVSVSNNTHPTWYKDVGIMKCVMFCCICFVAQITAGFDEGTSGSFQAMDSWQEAMDYPDASRVGLITSMLFAGGIVGGIIGAPIADNWGRRWVIITGASSCIAGTILQSAAVNVGMFITGRTLIGMGVVQTLMGGPSLVAEISHPRIRSTILTFYNVLWYVGSIFASWLTFGTGHIVNQWAWRIPSIAQCLPSLFIICMIRFVPESPRFLMAQGKRKEAHDILATYHANGDHNDELVLHELREIEEAVQVELHSKRQSYVEMLRSPANRKRIFIVLFVATSVAWCGQVIITYYFVPILDSIGVSGTNQQTGINGGMAVWNLLISILGACIANRVGRRALWLTSFIGMAVANIPLIASSAVYANNGSKGAAYISVITLFIYNGFFNIGCNPLPYSYTAEVLPYSIRSKGLAIYNIAGFAFGVATQYANPVALAAIGWKYYIIYLVLNAFYAVVIYFTFPETAGLGLEELAALADSNNGAYIITLGKNPTSTESDTDNATVYNVDPEKMDYKN